MKHHHILALFVTSTILSSCISNQPVSAAFRQNRAARVAVVTMQAPKAQVMHIGGQGIVDFAVNQAIASGRNRRLADYPAQAKLDEVGGRFVRRLNSLGYQAALIQEHPSKKGFVPFIFKGSAHKPLPGRDTYLRGYDAALFIDMPQVGQSQTVYAFIPLSGRKADAMLTGALFSVNDGKRLWRCLPKTPKARGIQTTQGPSSDINNIFRAIDCVVDDRAQALEADFVRGY